ncbi:hypothetical protein BV363_03017 [Pseudomonas syringae pv. actinidiae]|nr:hypothetical protein BV363_03017 [Pseudomonas syringae pv. actinidiae]
MYPHWGYIIGAYQIDGKCAMTSYHVLNENTLCYLQDGAGLYGVLAGKPQHGGHDWINGPVVVSSLDKLRPATLEDFNFYRVCPAGHIA